MNLENIAQAHESPSNLAFYLKLGRKSAGKKIRAKA